MTTATTRDTGPADDARLAHGAARVALRAAVARSAHLWRACPDPQAPVPRLTWSAAETAAHVVGDLREYSHALAGDGRPVLGTGSPSKRSALVNARHLKEVPERDMTVLAEML